MNSARDTKLNRLRKQMLSLQDGLCRFTDRNPEKSCMFESCRHDLANAVDSFGRVKNEDIVSRT